jgi:hypothetical protein
MTINKICDLLRSEFINNGYEYGFYLDGRRYTPDKSLGFDREYLRLSETIYRVQNPNDTKRERLGTCIDTCLLIKTLLAEKNICTKIWLICHRERKSVHTIPTFEAEGKIVYLELTPESKKPWYGKEIIYSSEEEFLSAFDTDCFDIFEVTRDIIVEEAPEFLLSHTR